MSVWVNVTTPQNSGVAGPFSGSGQFQLITAGIHTYATQQLAASMPSQTLNANQIQVLEKVILAGPGVGSGFFGLGHDIQAAPGAAISDIFHGLNLGSLLVRIGEVVLGIVLVAVGLAKITGTENLVTTTLKKVPL